MTGIIKLKYMLEISIYPNGKSYQKIFPIGAAQHVRREDAKKKSIEAKERQNKLIAEKEVKFEKNDDVEELF